MVHSFLIAYKTSGDYLYLSIYNYKHIQTVLITSNYWTNEVFEKAVIVPLILWNYLRTLLLKSAGLTGSA